MKTPILFCLWLSSLALFSQNIVWEKAFNKSKYDRFGCVRSTTDGGCIWGGEYYSRYLTDTIVSDDLQKGKGTEMWVVKLNALGDTEWEKTFGDSSDNSLIDIQQTRDGGYILLGTKFYPIIKAGVFTHYNNDTWVVKINSTGNVEWEKEYPQSQGFMDMINIQQTKDGGYFIGGTEETRLKDSANIHTSKKDMHVFKIDSKGNVQWRETYRMPKSYYLRCILQVSDGGYLLGGSSTTFDGDIRFLSKSQSMAFLIKINSKGKIKWEKKSFVPQSFSVNDIQPCPDGGYLLGGLGLRENRITDFCIMKINSKMQLQWRKYYGGSKVDAISNIVSNPDGTFVLAGTTKSMDGDVKSGYRGEGDYWVVKINAQGDILWEKTFGSSTDERIGNAQRTSNGCYYLGGTTGHSVGPLDGDINSRYPKEKTTESIASDVKSITKSGKYNIWIVKVKE